MVTRVEYRPRCLVLSMVERFHRPVPKEADHEPMCAVCRNLGTLDMSVL